MEFNGKIRLELRWFHRNTHSRFYFIDIPDVSVCVSGCSVTEHESVPMDNNATIKVINSSRFFFPFSPRFGAIRVNGANSHLKLSVFKCLLILFKRGNWRLFVCARESVIRVWERFKTYLKCENVSRWRRTTKKNWTGGEWRRLSSNAVWFHFEATKTHDAINVCTTWLCQTIHAQNVLPDFHTWPELFKSTQCVAQSAICNSVAPIAHVCSNQFFSSLLSSRWWKRVERREGAGGEKITEKVIVFCVCVFLKKKVMSAWVLVCVPSLCSFSLSHVVVFFLFVFSCVSFYLRNDAHQSAPCAVFVAFAARVLELTHIHMQR